MILSQTTEFIHKLISICWQSNNINTNFIEACSKCSILEPLLFNIYINDLFFALPDVDICNFADDSKSFVCDQNIKKNEKTKT